jgi:Family of unknown function (DUF5761)
MNHNKSHFTPNGRVDIMKKSQPDIKNLFALYDRIPNDSCTSLREPTLGIWDESPLSKAFFSRENIQIIQNGIRAGVYAASRGQYVIGNQDCESIKIIMRSVFLQHTANQPTNITGQINQLNQIVLDYCIPTIYGEAQGYMKYLYDVSTLAVPLAPPSYSSERDKNNYKLPNWF